MSNYIVRQNLIDLLYRGCEYSLILSIAPAGSGKSILLEQFSNHLAKVSPSTLVLMFDISERHDDKSGSCLFAQLFKAIKRIAPLWDEPYFNLFKDDREVETELLIDVFRQALTQLDFPLVIVFDDFHNLSSGQVQHTLEKLIYALPSHVTVVISSRYYPALSLTRMKTDGIALVIDSNDFKLSEDDLERLNKAIGAPQLDASQVVAVLQQTEGWFVGTKLALLALDKSNGTPMTVFNGSRSELLDYLGHEVIHRLSPGLKTFVLLTSVCQSFNRELCENAFGLDYGSAKLEEVRMQDLFLGADPNRQGWYRYHPLLREFLLKILEQENGIEYIQQLHLKASEFYLSIGDKTEAIYHARLSADQNYYLQILTQVCSDWFKEGDLEPIVRSLNDVSDELLNTHTSLLLYKLYALSFTRCFNQAAYYLEILKDIARCDSNTELTSYCRFFERILAVFQNDSEVEKYTLRKTKRQANTPVMVDAFNKLLDAYLLMCHGQLNEAFRVANDVLPSLQRMSHKFFESFATPIIILCDRNLGRGIEAVQETSKAFNPIRHGKKTPRWINLATAMMVVDYEQNQLDEAWKLGTELVPLVNHSCATEAVAMAYLYSSRLMHIEGDGAKAGRLLEQLERILSLGDYQRFCSQVIQEKIRQALVDAKQNECDLIFERYGLSEFMVKGEVQSSRHYEERRERLVLAAVYWLIAKTRYKQAIELLEELADALDLLGIKSRALVARSNCISIVFRQGHVESAIHSLTKLIERYGLVCFSRSVFDEAPGLADVFKAGIDLDKIKLPSLFRETFDSLLGTQRLSSHDVSLKHLLTGKEFEIFELLRSGITNESISQQSGIALSTTKWHLKNIYTKLGVSNRTEAVSFVLRQVD